MNPVFYHAGTVKIAATQVTAKATLPVVVGTNVVIWNAGPNTAFVQLGGSTVTALVPGSSGNGSMPVPLGFYGNTISRDPNTDLYVSAICNTGETATVYFSVGNGT